MLVSTEGDVMDDLVFRRGGVPCMSPGVRLFVKRQVS